MLVHLQKIIPPSNQQPTSNKVRPSSSDEELMLILRVVMCVPIFLDDHRCGHYRVQWQTCWVAQELDYNKSQAFRCWQRYITSQRALNSGAINPVIGRASKPPPCVTGGVVCTEIGNLNGKNGDKSDCPLIGDHLEDHLKLRSPQWIVSCNKNSQAVWMSELLGSRSCHLLLYGHYVWRGRSSVMLHYVNPHKTKELTWEEIAIPIADFSNARSQEGVDIHFLAPFIRNDHHELHEEGGTQYKKPYELSLLTSAQVSLFRSLKERKPRLVELTPGDIVPFYDWKEHRLSLIDSAKKYLSSAPVESLRNTKIKAFGSYPEVYTSSSSTFAPESVPRSTIPQLVQGLQQFNSNATPANMTRSFSEDPAAYVHGAPPMARSHTQASSSSYSYSGPQPLYNNPPPLVPGQPVHASNPSNPHWQPAHSYDRPPLQAGISSAYPRPPSQIQTSAIPPHGFPPQYQSQTMYSQAPQAYIPLPSSSFSGQPQVSVQHNQPHASTSGAPRLPPGRTGPHPVPAPTRAIDSHPAAGPSHPRHHHSSRSGTQPPRGNF